MPDRNWIAHRFAFSPNYIDDRTMCAVSAIGQHIICSHDAGATWQATTWPDTQNAGWGSGLALLDDHRLFLAVQAGPIYEQGLTGLFYSPDGGVTWERRLTGSIWDVAAAPNYDQDPNLLVIWGGYHIAGGILRSTDGGYGWQDASTGLGSYPDAEIKGLSFSPTYPADYTAFVINNGGLFLSSDAGVSWANRHPSAYGLYWGAAVDYAISPRYTQDRTIWLWGEPSSVTTDAGASWRALPHPPRPIAAADAYCPQSGDCGIELFGRVLDYETQVRYFAKSFDGGQSWLCLDEPDPPLPLPTPAPEIPEPAAWLLLGSGLAALAGWARQRR